MNIISWSKWKCPIGRNKDELEYVPEKDVVDFDNDQNTIYDEEPEQDSENDVDDNPRTVIITPLGVMPLRPFNDPTKVFNFWLGESNFSIDPDIAMIINDVPGVEFLDIFTRYKFRIAVGNLFRFQEVRQNIEKVLDATPPSKISDEQASMNLDEQSKLKVKQIINEKLANFPYWAMYICPNGQIDMTVSNEKDADFDRKLNIYAETKKLAGGTILKYDNQLV